MKRILATACIAWLGLLPGSVWASGIAVPGLGDKATSMGGAFRALANDWSAAWWNPAGLAYLETSEFTTQLMINVPRPNFTPDINLGGYALGYRNGTEWVPDDRIYYLPNAGGFYKIPNAANLKAGIAVLFPYAMGNNWDLFDPLPGYNPDIQYPGVDHELNFVVVDVHPTIAKEIVPDRLSAGLGISIQNGDINYRRVHFIPSGYPRPYDNYIMDSETEANGWGFGINLGFLYKASPKVQLGATYRSPVNIDLHGHTKQTVYFPDTSAVSNPYGLTASNKVSLDMTLKLPSEFGFGLALFPSEKFTLTADIAWTQWSRFDQWDLEYKAGSITPLGTSIPKTVALEWEDVTAFSVGVEYLARERLKLRAGFSKDPTPMPDQTISPLFIDFADKNRLNLGGSYSWEKYEVGYSFEYINFQDREVSTFSDVNNDGVYDNFPGKYASTVYGSHFYFTYRF